MTRPPLDFKTPRPKGAGRLYAVIDLSIIPPEGAGEAAREIIAGGAVVIQLRAKGAPSGVMLSAAKSVRAAGPDAIFIVNDRADIALFSGADGVHLGQDDMPVHAARRMLGKGAVIGVSTHNAAEAARAEDEGADYISFGPVFATKTKQDAQPPKGLAGLTAVRNKVKTPIVAIGGINEENIASVLNAGADACAVISDILYAKDIKAKTASIISRTLATLPGDCR